MDSHATMESVSVRDIKADGNARIHVGNSSVTHVHNYAEAQGVAEATPVPFALVPFSRDPDFISRGDLLDQITSHCSQPAGRAALFGLGGVGKSQLAIEYAYRTMELHSDSWVFWVHAGTKARVEEGFRAIADAVNLPGRHRQKTNVMPLLHAWLSNERNGKWLMILDSADDDQIFYGADKDQAPLATYLPQSRNGSILITTRDSNLAFRVAGNYHAIIKIGPMEPDQALSFLSKKTSSLADPQTGAELVKALDYIPLAISQAASYIQMRAPRCTSESYLAELRESDGKFARLLAHDAAELRRDGSASNAVMKTWQMSFDHIQTIQPSAAELLSLMSFFDRQSIPESVINPAQATSLTPGQGADTCANVKQSSVLNDFASLSVSSSWDSFKDSDELSDIDSVDDTVIQFEDDVTLLNAFCLISTCQKGKDFEMHRLVQLATKRWLSASKKQEQFKQLFIKRLSAAFPEVDPVDVSQQRYLFTHAQIATSYRPSDDSMDAWSSLCYNVGRFAQDERDHELARTLARKSLAGCDTEIEILACKQLYGEAIRDLGQLDEAGKVLTEVFEACKSRVQPSHGLALTTMVELSKVYTRQDRLKEAEELVSPAIEIAKLQFGLTDDRTLAYMSALAEIYTEQGQLDEAEALELYILETTKSTLGEEHEFVFITMERLSSVYRTQERFEEAYELQSKVVERWRFVFGPDHRDTLDSLCVLAQICQARGLEDKAEEIHLCVWKKRQALFGVDDLDTFESATRIASLYFAQGRYVESEKIYEAALQRSQLPKALEDKQAFHTQIMLAHTIYYQGRLSEATDMYARILASLKLQYGTDNHITLNCMLYLASRLNEQGLQEDAMKLLRTTLEKRRAFSGADHRDTIRITCELVTTLTKQQEFEEAESLARDLLVTCKAVHGPSDSATLDGMRNLAEIYWGQGRFEEGLALNLEIWELQLAKHGEAHSKTIDAKFYVGCMLGMQERYSESVETFRATFELSKSTAGPQDRDTLLYMSVLAHDLGKLGDKVAAVEIAQERLRICQEAFGPDDEDTLSSVEDLNDLMDIDSESDEDVDGRGPRGTPSPATTSSADAASLNAEQGEAAEAQESHDACLASG